MPVPEDAEDAPQYSRTCPVVSTRLWRKKGEYNDLQEKSLQISLAISAAYMSRSGCGLNWPKLDFSGSYWPNRPASGAGCPSWRLSRLRGR